MLLRGEQASILKQDEILQRMGAEPAHWRGLYRFFSSHAHSFPLAYYRMAEHGRGHGFENYVDKGYMGGALEHCAIILSTCTDAMRSLVRRPSYVSRDAPELASRQTLSRYAPGQGEGSQTKALEIRLAKAPRQPRPLAP
jgi:hypothetical protein